MSEPFSDQTPPPWDGGGSGPGQHVIRVRHGGGDQVATELEDARIGVEAGQITPACPSGGRLVGRLPAAVVCRVPSGKREGSSAARTHVERAAAVIGGDGDDEAHYQTASDHCGEQWTEQHPIYARARYQVAAGNREQALALLAEYADSGYRDVWPSLHPDLTPLRELPAFAALLDRLTPDRQPLADR